MKKTVALASLMLAFIQIAAHAQSPAKPIESKAAETELAELDRRLQEALTNGDVKLLGPSRGAVR